MTKLFDIRAHDGSRHFVSLSANRDWYAARDHVARLSGAKLTGFLCDGATEAWIDFAYKNHSFTINDQFGEYWFFVDDPLCPEEILREIAVYWEQLLGVPNRSP